MEALYPSPADLKNPDVAAWITRIARHSKCDQCRCIGLNPPMGISVLLAAQDPYTVDSPNPHLGLPYLAICACGHEANAHGTKDLEADEFRRRAKLAVQMDACLRNLGNLFDFSPSQDHEVVELRAQIQSASYVPEPAQPPPKKRKVTPPSEPSDEEDEKPLAASWRPKPPTPQPQPHPQPHPPPPPPPPQLSGMKSTAHTAPASLPPPSDTDLARMNGHVPPLPPHPAPQLTRMDSGQVSRLASGVTVDSTNSEPAVKPEKPAAIELRKGIIEITAVENDGSPRSIVILTGLKTLFQKQLPNMPREYIARLVYDETSKGVAIIKRGYKVAGGIAYRPFPHRGFAEIIFFATASVDQIKGYGAMLMDHFKAHIQKAYPGMLHFLTYADNYAVGYFKKQGFSKEITLDRSVWAGYIKDYEGGTIMQCTMLPKVDYLNKNEIIVAQKEAILNKIREMSKSHIVHAGITSWNVNSAGDGLVELDPKTIPGLRESGWTPHMMDSTARATPRSPEHHFMQQLIQQLRGHSSGWAFVNPVNGDDVTDYYDIIANPMDFTTMGHKLDTHQYSNLDPFVADVQLIFDNTRKYNGEDSTYAKNARTLEGFFKRKLREGKLAIPDE